MLAQLLEARTAVSSAYEGLFPPLLMPTMWERPANIPALVRLIIAYMAKGKALVLAKLEGVLGVFQKLLASRATDAAACKLLSAIFSSFEAAELSQFMSPIFTLTLTRLQSNKKFGPSLVGCWAVFIARFGAPALRSTLESLQPGLFLMLLNGLWKDGIGAVQGAVPRKAAAIGTARLLTECPETLADEATFGAVLHSLLVMLMHDQGISTAPADADADDVADGIEGADGAGGAGYAASYNQLTFAGGAEADLYAAETVAPYLQKSLTRLNASANGVLPGLLQRLVATMPADKQAGVQAMLQGVC